jgi:dienelactone hydrolase
MEACILTMESTRHFPGSETEALDMDEAAFPAGSLLGAYGSWIDGLMSARRHEYSFLDARWKDVAVWSREARALFAGFALAPALGAPGSGAGAARLVGREIVDGLVVEELEWSLPFGPATRACFLKPAKASGRLPGVLALHDHGGEKHFGKGKIADGIPGAETGSGGEGKDEARLHPLLKESRDRYYGGRAWANELAARGYGVLVHDIFPFGSRKILASGLPAHVVERMTRRPQELRELMPEDLAPGRRVTELDVPEPGSVDEIRRYDAFAGQHESTIAKSLFCAGTSWPGLVLAEDRAALDYLLSRDDIDPERIGCGGLSGGGQRTNYLAGTDSRIRCSVTAGFMTTWADLALNTAYTHTWMIYLPGLPRFMDYPDILAMRAPLPALVLATRQDPLFTPAEVARAESVLEETWRKAGAAGRFRMSWHEGGHKFDAAMQEEAFEWFGRWL